LNALRYATDPALDYLFDHHFPSWVEQGVDFVLHLVTPENLILAGEYLLARIKIAVMPLFDLGVVSNKWTSSAGIHHLTFEDLFLGTDNVEPSVQRQSMGNTSAEDIKLYLSLLWDTICGYMDRLDQRWHQLALGKSGLDRGICALVGYIVLLSVGSWCLTRQRGGNKGRIHRVAIGGISEFIRQQGIFFKVFVFVALELVLLPIICGILLNLATLPLIENASVSTRWEFAMAHPYCACFLHWFVGTGFMFHFAMFITLSREIVRPGVMWFIRDPNDPQFHPVQEIMERPLLLLLRKLCTGALLYLSLIVVGMGTVIWSVSRYTSINYIRWAFE
jgi:hypothetical protein